MRSTAAWSAPSLTISENRLLNSTLSVSTWRAGPKAAASLFRNPIPRSASCTVSTPATAPTSRRRTVWRCFTSSVYVSVVMWPWGSVAVRGRVSNVEEGELKISPGTSQIWPEKPSDASIRCLSRQKATSVGSGGEGWYSQPCSAAHWCMTWSLAALDACDRSTMKYTSGPASAAISPATISNGAVKIPIAATAMPGTVQRPRVRWYVGRPVSSAMRASRAAWYRSRLVAISPLPRWPAAGAAARVRPGSVGRGWSRRRPTAPSRRRPTAPSRRRPTAPSRRPAPRGPGSEPSSRPARGPSRARSTRPRRLQRPAQVDGARRVVAVGHHDGALHSEDEAGAEAGVVGVEFGVVEGDGGGRHAVADRIAAHGCGLVVAGRVIVSGHQQAVDLSHPVQADGRVQAIGQEVGGRPRGGEPGAQHERDLVVADVGGIRG